MVAPAPGGFKLRTERAYKEQSNAFAQEVSIRRKIRGQITLNVSCIEGQRTRQIHLETRRNQRAIRKEMSQPEPGQAAKCDLKAATPVDPHGVGVRGLPSIPLANQFVDVGVL